MLEHIDKAIGGIIAIGVGVIFTLFSKKTSYAFQRTFLGTLGIGEKLQGSQKVAHFFILLMGILFLLVGCYLIYQFFSPFLVSYRKDLGMGQIDIFLDNHLSKLKEKNYEAAYADFSDAAKKAFPLPKYLQLQKLIESKLGSLDSFERTSYQKKVGIGIGRQPASAILTYKMKYSKEEAFFTFIIVKEKGELKIYHYNISSPVLASEELRKIFESK